MKNKLLIITIIISMLLPCLGMGEVCAFEDVIASDMPFKDIPENAWYRESAEFCYANEIIKGQGNEYTFAPDAFLTRAIFTVMLARGLDADISGYEGKTSFSDCPVGAWYTESVEWAYDKGYVKGTSEYKFSPNIAISREEAAVILSRVLALKAETDSLSAYTDAEEVSIWAKDSVNSVLGAKLMGSTSTKKLVFSPKMTMTRAQASKILMSILKDHIHGKCEHSIKDADCKKGSYCEKCGLVFSLPVEHYSPEVSCKSSGECVYYGKEIPADASLHRNSEYSCTEDTICRLCGVVTKKAQGHDFIEISCTLPKYCYICGASEGEAAGHDYEGLSCTDQGECAKCHSIIPKLGHTCYEGVCERCGNDVVPTEYERLAAQIYKDHKPHGYNVTYTKPNGDKENVYIHSNGNTIDISYAYEWKNGFYTLLQITIVPDSPKSYYSFYVNGNDDISYSSYVLIEGTIYSKTMEYDVQYSWCLDGKDNYMDWGIENCGVYINRCLKLIDSLLKDLYGTDVGVFGFEI